MVSKSDIADKVANRRGGIPSACTSAVIQEWVDDAHIKIENRTGESFSTSDIPEKFQALITDMAVSYLLEYLIKRRASVSEANFSYSDLIAEKKMLDSDIKQQMNDIISISGSVTTTEPRGV